MFKGNNENTKMTLLTSFWYFLLTYFKPFSSVSNVDFEQVNFSLVESSIVGSNNNITNNIKKIFNV